MFVIDALIIIKSVSTEVLLVQISNYSTNQLVSLIYIYTQGLLKTTIIVESIYSFLICNTN